MVLICLGKDEIYRSHFIAIEGIHLEAILLKVSILQQEETCKYRWIYSSRIYEQDGYE